jgi:hypothetical protein
VNGQAGLELLAVKRLDDQPAAGDENPAKLAHRAQVPVFTQVPERRAEAEDGREPPRGERQA